MTIGTAKNCGALGFAPKAVYDEDNPYIYHFPDGNAGVARALVKKMIPNVGEGKQRRRAYFIKIQICRIGQIQQRYSH